MKPVVTSVAFEKYIRDGKVAVLYSPGYGAGWYTWNDDQEGMIFDRELVAAVLAEDYAALKEIAARKYPEAYLGGGDKLEIEWLEPGTVFVIDEYDGSESIRPVTEIKTFTA
jgi:hypothetical protein